MFTLATTVYADSEIWNYAGNAYYTINDLGEETYYYNCANKIMSSCGGEPTTIGDTSIQYILLIVVGAVVFVMIRMCGIKIKIPSFNMTIFNQNKQSSYLLPHPKYCCEDCGIHHKHYCEINKVECSLK